ncbi:MAG: helix-turn-helix domain-containing protein [Campylobacteraceae bacterium]|nr:helix-turn-helix domain-containing protein [Campylobacteraceae bacterium]
MGDSNFFAVIPANVRYDKRLTPAARLFYGELTACATETACVLEKNSYFAELLGVSEQIVQKWLIELKEVGLLSWGHTKEYGRVIVLEDI